MAIVISGSGIDMGNTPVSNASQIDGVVINENGLGVATETQVGTANSALVKTALNATGTAPIYACRAWVNFNGTGTVAIRASGNVSSITDNNVGEYSVNFTTPMIDVNYSKAVHNSGNTGVNTIINISSQVGNTVSKTDIIIVNTGNNAAVDTGIINCAVFR